jgi:hypothetical protein
MPYAKGSNQYLKRGWRSESALLRPTDLMAQAKRLHDELGDPEDLKWPRSLITLSRVPWDDLDPVEQTNIRYGVCIRHQGETDLQFRQRQAMVALLRDGLTGTAARDRALAQAQAAAAAQAPDPIDTSVLRIGPNRAGNRAAPGQRFQGVTRAVENILAQYPDREFTADEMAIVLDEHGVSVEAHGERGKLTAQKVQRVKNLLRGLEWAPGGAPGTVQRIEREGHTVWRYNPNGNRVLQTVRALDARVAITLSTMRVDDEFDEADLMIAMSEDQGTMAEWEFNDTTEARVSNILGALSQQGVLQRHGARWKVTADCSVLGSQMDTRVLDSQRVRETVLGALGGA